MCGIAGYLLHAPRPARLDKLETLLAPIRRRGPDDEGVCLISRPSGTIRPFCTRRTAPTASVELEHVDRASASGAHDVALLHTRYSIIDLSAGGHQPFASRDGKVTAVFNGEIYNYLELRAELESCGVTLRTKSDTEVLVEGFCLWGSEIWNKMNGFWAVALYDAKDRCVTLSRDRLGVAPLYYRDCSEGFYFASSLRSLVDVEPENVTFDKDVVWGFVRTSIKDFDDTTCFQQVRSLPPATVMRFDSRGSRQRDAKTEVFWQLPSQRWSLDDFSLSEAVQQFRDTFVDAVNIRLRADVKVACELSGGLDSSSVTAVAATLRGDDISTYTIEVPESNEEPYARAMLEMYRLDYHVLSDPEDTFEEEEHAFTRFVEEPYHSPNIYTHYKMRQRMKNQGVDVVLSGAGGDEVLAGYEMLFWPAASQQLKSEGARLTAMTYDLFRRFGSRERLFQSLRRCAGSAAPLVQSWQERFSRYGRHPIRSIHNRLHRRPYDSESFGPANDLTRAEQLRDEYGTLSYEQQRRYQLRVAMLPYYLRSNDHFTMAIPLEHRFPMLDYRIVELGFQMPIEHLFYNGWTKYVLRKAMEPFLPQEILWRKQKMGFPFPLRRFLADRKSFFEPLVEKVRTEVRPQASLDYETLLKINPKELWRICSAGLWLKSLQYSQNAHVQAGRPIPL